MTAATAQGGRPFTMSAFSALIALRRYLQNYTDVSAADAASALRRSDADLAAADFDAAIEMHASLPPEIVFDPPEDGIRASLTFLIETGKPWWRRYFPLGRQRLASALSTNEQQCFSAAGLLAAPPPLHVVAWWDHFAAQIRAEENVTLSDQGRHAEALTMEYERKRLKDLGLDLEPIWKSIESNGFGYDIQSFDPGPFGPINRLIEVKSTKSKPPRIILTRSEWEAAEKYGEALRFYIWLLPADQPLIWTATEMAAHIPIDKGDGCWERLDITI